jgi:hypothetical protein
VLAARSGSLGGVLAMIAVSRENCRAMPAVGGKMLRESPAGRSGVLVPDIEQRGEKIK